MKTQSLHSKQLIASCLRRQYGETAVRTWIPWATRRNQVQWISIRPVHRQQKSPDRVGNEGAAQRSRCQWVENHWHSGHRIGFGQDRRKCSDLAQFQETSLHEDAWRQNQDRPTLSTTKRLRPSEANECLSDKQKRFRKQCQQENKNVQKLKQICAPNSSTETLRNVCNHWLNLSSDLALTNSNGLPDSAQLDRQRPIESCFAWRRTPPMQGWGKFQGDADWQTHGDRIQFFHPDHLYTANKH